MSSVSLQSASSNMCRICHTSSSTRANPLISPCRCSGTLLFVHKACVVVRRKRTTRNEYEYVFQRWLEMSTRKMVPSPRCELCGYDYRRANIFQMRSIHVPHVDRSSCVLNMLFLVTVFIMVFCGYFTIQFIQENALLKRRLEIALDYTLPFLYSQIVRSQYDKHCVHVETTWILQWQWRDRRGRRSRGLLLQDARLFAVRLQSRLVCFHVPSVVHCSTLHTVSVRKWKKREME